MVGLGKEVRHLAQARGSLATGVEVARVNALGVVVQDAAGRGGVAAPHHLFHILANIARRNGPGLGRKQHLALLFCRHARPELPVEDFGMGLHIHPGLTHLLFVCFQDVSQRADFALEPVEQLHYGVGLDVAVLVAFQGKAHRHPLRQLQQHGVVGPQGLALRSHAHQRLRQRRLPLGRQLMEILLDSDDLGG